MSERRDPKHLKFIRSLPCCITGLRGMVEAAHIRSGTDGGMGLKPSDCWTVPLTHAQHYKQHQVGERRFWDDLDRARQLARDLYAVTGDMDAALKLIVEFRE